jgi:hypothetical protein
MPYVLAPVVLAVSSHPGVWGVRSHLLSACEQAAEGAQKVMLKAQEHSEAKAMEVQRLQVR